MPENVSLLPIIPCPSCGMNILDAGFHNTCTENVRVREDNFTYTKYGRLYLGQQQGDETVDHESDLEAYCGSCNKLLPWPTYAIRCLDGLTLREAGAKAAELVRSGEISGGNAWFFSTLEPVSPGSFFHSETVKLRRKTELFSAVDPEIDRAYPNSEKQRNSIRRRRDDGFLSPSTYERSATYVHPHSRTDNQARQE